LAWEEAFSGCKMGEQMGMPNSRPMPIVAAGASEFRVKKTRRTPPLEIELARKRLKELLDA